MHINKGECIEKICSYHKLYFFNIENVRILIMCILRLKQGFLFNTVIFNYNNMIPKYCNLRIYLSRRYKRSLTMTVLIIEMHFTLCANNEKWKYVFYDLCACACFCNWYPPTFIILNSSHENEKNGVQIDKY